MGGWEEGRKGGREDTEHDNTEHANPNTKTGMY
jgi:hypothetical protein